jgi:hypothetical protein
MNVVDELKSLRENEAVERRVRYPVRSCEVGLDGGEGIARVDVQNVLLRDLYRSALRMCCP